MLHEKEVLGRLLQCSTGVFYRNALQECIKLWDWTTPCALDTQHYSTGPSSAQRGKQELHHSCLLLEPWHVTHMPTQPQQQQRAHLHQNSEDGAHDLIGCPTTHSALPASLN